jgi:hypothetical protein
MPFRTFLILAVILAACGRNPPEIRQAESTGAQDSIRDTLPRNTVDPVAGTYTWKQGGAEAELAIARIDGGQYHVQGEAFWGMDRMGGPHIGEVKFIAPMKDSVITYRSSNGGYTIRIGWSDGQMSVSEDGICPDAGVNVTFAGKYKRER